MVKADPSRRDLMGLTPLRVVLAQEIRRFALVEVEVMVGDILPVNMESILNCNRQWFCLFEYLISCSNR